MKVVIYYPSLLLLSFNSLSSFLCSCFIFIWVLVLRFLLVLVCLFTWTFYLVYFFSVPHRVSVCNLHACSVFVLTSLIRHILRVKLHVSQINNARSDCLYFPSWYGLFFYSMYFSVFIIHHQGRWGHVCVCLQKSLWTSEESSQKLKGVDLLESVSLKITTAVKQTFSSFNVHLQH